MTIAEINKLIQELSSEERGKVSDTYHDFDTLYEFRKVYNAALFNEWASDWRRNKELREAGKMIGKLTTTKHDVHKSWRHHDGELCLGGDRFIVVAVLPTGQISNHYHASDWDLFKVPIFEKAKYEWDGHSSQDCIDRLKAL